MEYIQKYFYSIIIVVFMTSPSMAENEFYIGASLLKYDYAEYTDTNIVYDGFEGDDNIFLDGEKGLIPGIVIKVKENKLNYYYEWEGRLNYNKIKYNGESSAGTPLKTDSDALIIDTHIKLGKKIDFIFEQEQSLYIGLGYRYWLRNIHSGSDVNGNLVAGLLEEYSWFYTLAGYTMKFNAAENVRMGFDFRVTHMFNAEMDINFLGYKSYDNTSVELGNRIGARFAFPIEIKKQRTTYFVTPYYELINIGISNSVPITSNGVQQGSSLWEPRSETRNVGIEVTWMW